MVGCSIRNCKSISVKGGPIRFFSFPQKESVANEWLRHCKPKTTIKYGRVCSKHFVSSDYIMSLRHILLNESPRKFQKLKPDALPTLMMDAVIENKNTLNMPELSPTPANNIALSSKNDRNIGENITIPLAEYKVLKQSYQEYDVLKKNMAKIFTPGQIRCLTNTNKRRVNWSAEDIAAAISLRSISPKGYRYLRTTVGLPLPAFSTLRKWASKFEIKEGLLENVITLMKFKTKSFNDLQKLVTLSFDEIYLSNKIEIDKKYEQKIGPHNTCQCVMARGLCAKWKQPIYFKCDQKMTKDILFYIIKNMHEAGLTVVALTCDMGPGNQGLMKSLNIGVEDGKQTYFHHPSDSRLKVHVFFDVPHLLKLARNHFIDHGFIYNNKVLTKQTIEKILAISQNDFKLAHKITQHHLNLQGSQRQKVRPAAQLFSNTVAQAIKWCGIKGFLPDENWLELTYIFKVFNDWFDVMNSRMKFEGHKNAYGINLDAQNLVLAEMDHLMGNIKTGKKTSTAPFQKGILISNKSLTNLLLDLKERNNINLEYIMSSRLNQDVLENFFSYIRSMGATHDHPTALSFKHRLKWYILGKQSADVFKCSSNTRDDPSACLIAPLEQPGTSTCDAPEEPEPITEDEDVILTGILNSYVELEHQGNDNESSSLITSLQSDELEVGKSFSQCDIAFYFPTNEEQELLNAFELQMACTEVKEQGLIYIAGYVASRYLSTSTPLVYVNETCLECERVRAACERLGTVAIAPSAEALSPPQQLPTSPPYLITTPFEGELFDTAHRAKYRVLGPTAVLQLAERDEPPPANSRPLYSLAMRGAVICFSGFRKKEELTYLINLIHYMGGSIRKDMSSKVTHLIAAAATGDKYRYASGFGLPVLARSWVDACWERRDDPTCFATNDDIIKEHKLMVFAGARVCFVGFPEDETQHMADVLASNGGSTCQIDDPDCSHVVMANGETFGRSLILSSHPSTPNSAKPSRATPNRSQSTPKSSLYRRLSARLSGRRASPTKHSDVAEDEHEKRLQLARNSIRDKYTKALSRDETDHLYSISYAEKSFSDDLCFNYDNAKSPSHVERVEYRKYKMCDKENKDVSPLVHSSDRINNKDKREVFRNKSMNVFNLVDCLTEAGSVHSSLTKSLCDLESKDEPVFQLANSTAAKELQQSTTTISSGKKRSRKSTDSNFQVSTVDSNLSPDKCEDSNWKSIKRLKIKDSFKFKNRPTIFKRTKKESVPKPTGDIVVEPVSPDSVKPTDPAGEFVASTSSPIKEDDNASICSLNTSKQSGFFDISFASIRSSKTVKSASKLRRSVKSFTASFRSERKKKYEKRNTVDVDACHLPANLKHVSTPKTEFDGMNLDISPVQVDTVDSTELGTYSREPDVDELDDSNIFKTPQSVWLRAQRHSICDVSTLGGGLHSPRRPRPAPLAPAARDQPPPASTPPIRDAHTILQCHGISLPVVDEHNTIVAPECPPKVHIVKAEWFWASVQNEEAQDERDYLFKDYLDEVSRRSSVGGAGAVVTEEAGAGTTPAEASGTPSHLQRLRKRKLRGGDSALHKRRSSVGDAVLLSLSGNLLDCTPSPDGKQLLEESEVPDTVVRKLLSPRQQVFMELLQTESNYVGILHTIVTMFKQPLEEMAEEDNSNGKNQALLNNTELKIIFGNLPPIYELHQRMLEELRYAQAHWSEETSIGRLVLRYTPDMEKAYPPFVNFFENTKEMLQQCDRENPRFHAFLKICQTKPECGRQSLQELLIRPVQRLPSISLLLDDILKHTHKNNPDHAALDRALAGLRKVMSHINEDKRKTEGQLQMFDIYNDIDQCPPHLVSSHRSFVSRCEVVELSKELSGRGDHLVLFLFTDTMEVCKKRSKAFNSKSPTNGTGTMRIGSSKPYRHISLMPLSTVKRVVDIREAEDCHNVFALMCRNNQELKEKLYSFMITDETVDKTHFLRQLCRQMANTVCKADADKFLACLDSHQLDIDTSDLALSALSKVSKFAARTRIKVGRAFSFNKTPSKLKRAMSSMISPFGSTSNLTPASQLAQMRLASCNNINEMGTSGGGAEGGEVLVAPLSVQPTRKAAAGQALRRF